MEAIIRHHPSNSGDINARKGDNLLNELAERRQDHLPLARPLPWPQEPSSLTERISLPAYNHNLGTLNGTRDLLDQIKAEFMGSRSKSSTPLFVTGDYLTYRNVLASAASRSSHEPSERYTNIHSTSSPFHFQLNDNYRIVDLYYGSHPHRNPADFHEHVVRIRNKGLDPSTPKYHMTEDLLLSSLSARIINRVT